MILLKEEYGYRSWFWFPGIESEQLESLWKSNKYRTDEFINFEDLPGDLIEILDESELMRSYEKLDSNNTEYRAHMHMACDSFLQRPNGTKITNDSYEE